MQFKDFGAAVAKQFQTMTATGLFHVGIDKDRLWETYLGSFPAGSNPIYKTRTEHDCQCCKQFIRLMGSVVTIAGGKLVTLWDFNDGKLGSAYQVVADAMAALVRTGTIDNVFLHTERSAGTEKSLDLSADRSVITWNHFFVHLPRETFVLGANIGTKLADTRSTHDVMLRGLREITMDAVDTVLELISQNSLYRGEEHRATVEGFRKLKVEFSRVLPGQDLAAVAAAEDLFVWSRLKDTPASISRVRNTVIGSLLTDLSEGKDLEDAVKMFESKVAPTNYKRPTALVSKAMIQKAQATVEELGFTSALERRYATLEDITVNNILFADRAAKKVITNVFDDLAAGTPERKTKKLDKVEEIGIEDFLANVLPKAESLEVMVENRHSGNLVSLVAPCDPTAKNMFKWPNNFSWSYNGDLADSIKERVKRAGGSVVGDLCCRLAWDYTDDLDFHMLEPNGGHIYYMNRRERSRCGGMLDVDANGADGIMKDPVENIFYADRMMMKQGVYTLQVNNYCRRSSGQGFEVEIEFDGQIHHLVYEKALRDSERVAVAEIQYSHKDGFRIGTSLPSTQASKTVWGVPTQTFHKVNVVMLSPNYWDEKAVGNKHFFFMLEGCLNDGKARPFFNEFLTEALAPHRKVFEVVGAKMKTEESDRQLSGLGFSSTQRNSILCRVKGNFTRTVKVVF
jgi:hypothetical protein